MIDLCWIGVWWLCLSWRGVTWCGVRCAVSGGPRAAATRRLAEHARGLELGEGVVLHDAVKELTALAELCDLPPQV